MSTKVTTKVIQWENPGRDDIVWRYPEDEMRYGSALVVREWEGAAFLRDGKLFDIFGPGRHLLTTANLPLLTKAYSLLMGYKETPFKADVVFFSKKMFDGRWGINTLVKAAPDLQAPITLKANGDYQFRIDDPVLFITQILGGQKSYATGTNYSKDVYDFKREGNTNTFMRGFLNEKLIQEFSKYTYMDVLTNLEATSRKVQVGVGEAFAQRGIQILSLRVTGVDTDEKYKKDLYEFQRFREKGGRDYQQMKIMEKLAESIGSSDGVGLGAGMLVLPQMYQQLNQQPGQQAQRMPCPYCGRPNEYPYQYCGGCGKPPVMEKPAASATAEQAPKADPGTRGSDAFSACPYCGKDLNLPKTPRFCPYCKERLTTD